MNKKIKPTVKDVAKRAGVSKSLVSLVTQESPYVSDERRAAVLQAVEELNYRPNAMARSLVQQRSHVLGVMLSNLHNPFFADVVTGIEAEALERGYRAFFNTGIRVPEREAIALETLLQLQADGLILAGTLLDMTTINNAGKAVPIVLISRTRVYGIALTPGSVLPDALFYLCGAVIGAAGGVIQSASRTMMVRQARPGHMAESFGLYGLAGKATAFIAPTLIGVVTATTGSQQIGVSPLIGLFLIGLVLLVWVKPQGDSAE